MISADEPAPRRQPDPMLARLFEVRRPQQMPINALAAWLKQRGAWRDWEAAQRRRNPDVPACPWF